MKRTTDIYADNGEMIVKIKLKFETKPKELTFKESETRINNIIDDIGEALMKKFHVREIRWQI